ncbi:MAG: DUF6580 family putative transport protein [Verrucomicrobiales bacterium]
MSKRLISGIFLVLVFVAIRTLPAYAGGEVQEGLANISPMAALALCGGMFLPRRLGAGLTFGAFITSDILLNLHYHQPLLNPYSIILLFVFAVLFMGGHFLRKNRGLMVLLGAGVGGTVLFYLATNTAAFFYDPAYPKIFSGWVQANTLGVPGYPPSWVFGLRSLAGNLVFALAFYLALRPRREVAAVCAAVRAA